MRLAAALVLAVLTAACGGAEEVPAAPVAAEPNAAPPQDPSDPDAAVLRALEAAGSDLSLPHEIEFFVHVPTMDGSVAVTMALIPTEFASVRSEKAADGDRWVCIAKKTMVPDPAALRAIRKRLTALAAQHEGEYDGWGAAVAGKSD